MRFGQLAVVVMFVSLFGSACNCAGREFTVKKTFDVHGGPDDALCQTDRLVINLQDDSAFKDLKSNLGKVELRKINLKVTNPKTREDSLATKGNGKVRVANAETGAGTELGTYADVPITQDSTQDIPFDPAAASSLASLALNPPNTFYIEAEGCSDAVPAFYQFQVELTLYAELKLF